MIPCLLAKESFYPCCSMAHEAVPILMEVGIYMRVCRFVYICMHVCMYVCMNVCMCVYMYVRIHVCIYVCMYVCMYECTFVLI